MRPLHHTGPPDIHATLSTPSIRGSIAVGVLSSHAFLDQLHVSTLNSLCSQLQGDFGHVGQPGPPGEDGEKVSLEETEWSRS